MLTATIANARTAHNNVNNAKAAGRQAFTAGLWYNDNPYNFGEAHDAWNTGFADAARVEATSEILAAETRAA